MSLETSHDQDDLAALDSLFHKYGSSSASQKNKQLDSEGALADVPQAPSKSFLQEIQERAQILSRQRERTAKNILHSVVAQPSQEDKSEEHLDDVVKLIRSAPIEDPSSHTRHHQSTPATQPVAKSRIEQGSYDYWSSQYTKPTLWDSERAEESKDYKSDSESGSTCTEETDTEDTDSDGSELNFTWELNTTHPDLDSKQDINDTRSSGYFELEGLEDLGSPAGPISDGYFHLSAIDDNQTMADGNEPPIPIPDSEQLPDDGVVALSDDEQVPSAIEGALHADDEHVMDIDDSKKSFRATLGDEKAIDGFIDNASDIHNKSASGENDDVVSGDETSVNKAPSEDEDWVMLPKSSEVESKDMDVGKDDDEKHHDKKRKIEDDTDGVVEKIKKDDEDSDSDVDESRLPPPDLGADEEEEEEEDEGYTIKNYDNDDDDEDETDGIKGGIPESITDGIKKDEKEKEDQKEEKEEDKTEEDEPTVVLRHKPQSSLHPQQRYSLPEFDIFDTAKRLDTGMLKSRAKLGKQGALAQRRKPTKQDPSKRQTWMFGDPNDTQNLLNLGDIEEEAERSHIKSPRRSEPIDLHRTKEEESTSPSPKPRKPIGAIGGPMLLAGLGGPHMLKKTPKHSPLEDKPLTLAHTEDNDDDEPPIPKPRSSPAHRSSAPKTTPAVSKTQSTTSHAEPPSGKTPPPKLIKPKPARPSPASKPPKPNQSPSWAKPKPRPRPASSVDGVRPNHDILSAQKEEEPKVPAWMAEAKRLPPISPRTNGESEGKPEVKSDKPEGRAAKKPVPVPAWKQELLKKKKEGGEAGPKRHSMPPPVAKKPDVSGVQLPYTTMPQWQMDLAEKKNLRKKKEAEIGSREETPKVPAWKREAAERAVRIQKAQEEKAKKDKEKEEKARKDKEEKQKLEKDKSEKEKKEESAPLSTKQTTSSTPAAIIKNNVEENNEKNDKPKPMQWKGDNHEKTKKIKDTENKAPKPKVLTKKPILSPKPKPVPQSRPANNDDIPQWKKDLVKKRRTSDWRSRLRSASIDQEPTSPTSKTNNESNKFNENEQNSTTDKDTKRHTICTITDLPVKIPRNPPSGNVPQWKIDLEQKNRRLRSKSDTSHHAVPDN